MSGRPESANSSECSDHEGNEVEDSIPQLSFTRPSVGWNLGINLPVPGGGGQRASVFGGTHRLSINPANHRLSIAHQMSRGGNGGAGGGGNGFRAAPERTGKRMSLAVAVHQNPQLLAGGQSTPVECAKCGRFREQWARIRKDFPQLEAIVNIAGNATQTEAAHRDRTLSTESSGVRIEGPNSPLTAEQMKSQLSKSLEEVSAVDLRMMMADILTLQISYASSLNANKPPPDAGRIRSESIAAGGESTTSNVSTGGDILALAETSRSSTGGAPPTWDLGGFKFGTSVSRRESTCSHISHLSLASTARGATKATATAARADGEDGTMELNQYILLEELGHGTQGTVYLGFDQDTQDFRAIKEVKRPLPTSSEMNQLKAEIAIMKRLRHRNIIALHEVIDDPAIRRLYLVLQYAEKGCLAKHTVPDKTQCEPMDQGEFVNIARQLTAGLAYLHDHDILHRDIKPENVLRGRNDQVFLADFGVSQVLDDVASQSLSSVQQSAIHPTLSQASLPSAPTTTSPSMVQTPEQGNLLLGPSPVVAEVIGLNGSEAGGLQQAQETSGVTPPPGSTPKRQQQPLKQPPIMNSPTNASLKKAGSGLSSAATSAARYIPTTRGTPAFFAPEILGGSPEEDVDGKAVDIWALGVTFYMLLCGHLPFNDPPPTDSRQISAASSGAMVEPQGAAEGISKAKNNRVSIIIPGPGNNQTNNNRTVSSETTGTVEEPSIIDVVSASQLVAGASKGASPLHMTDVDWKKYRSRVLKHEVEYPASLSPVWVEVLKGMLCKDPGQRWTLREIRSKIKKMKIIEILSHLANTGSSGLGTLSMLEAPSSPGSSSPHRHSRTFGPGGLGSRASSPLGSKPSSPKSSTKKGASPKNSRKPIFSVPELVVQDIEKAEEKTPPHNPSLPSVVVSDENPDAQYEPSGPGRSPQRLRVTVAAAQRHSGIFLEDGNGNLPAPPSGASTEPPSQDPSRRPSSLSLPREEIEGAFTPVREQSIVPSFDSHIMTMDIDGSRSNSLIGPPSEKEAHSPPPVLSTAATVPDLMVAVDMSQTQQQIALNPPPSQIAPKSAPSPSLGSQ